MSSDNVHKSGVSSFDSLLIFEWWPLVKIHLGVLRTSEDLKWSITLEGHTQSMGGMLVQILVDFLQFRVESSSNTTGIMSH